MSNPLVIGFTGKKGSGKTEAARMVSASFGFAPVSFADPLRIVCATVFGLSDEELLDRELKEKPLSRWPFVSPRYLMQVVGTDMFRKHFPEVWIKAFQRICLHHGVNVVVADVRFLNEANAIKELGGWVVRVDRGLHAVDPHPSEMEMDLIEPDLTIQNTGTLGEFQAAVILRVSELLKEVEG